MSDAAPDRTYLSFQEDNNHFISCNRTKVHLASEGKRLLLDKGYAYPKCRKALRRRGIASMIPERKDQREQRQKKGSRGGRPCRFSREEYGQRSWVERLVNRLKQWRRIATRYEKRAEHYRAFVLLGCIMLWL